jgi:hypothetical protein
MNENLKEAIRRIDSALLSAIIAERDTGAIFLPPGLPEAAYQAAWCAWTRAQDTITELVRLRALVATNTRGQE